MSDHVTMSRSPRLSPTPHRLFLAELRKLSVDVEAFLLAAMQAEKYVRSYLSKTPGATLRTKLPELIRRDCITAPSVLLELSLLRLLKRDDVALRRAGDALGEPSRLRKRRPRSLEDLERIEKLVRAWAAADSVTKLAVWRNRMARSAGFPSGATFLRQLQTARKNRRMRNSPSSPL